jgi:hypothetical protein
MWLQTLTDTAERAKSTLANRAEVIIHHKRNMPEALLCLGVHRLLECNIVRFGTKFTSISDESTATIFSSEKFPTRCGVSCSVLGYDTTQYANLAERLEGTHTVSSR